MKQGHNTVIFERGDACRDGSVLIYRGNVGTHSHIVGCVRTHSYSVGLATHVGHDIMYRINVRLKPGAAV